MNPPQDTRWHEIDALLDRLFDASPETRETILRRVEAEDAEKAQAARRLLATAEAVDLVAGGALAAGLLRGIVAPAPGAADSAIGERIGSWRLIGELGRGGMGRVYLAERADGQFEQQVALKLLSAGPHSDDLLRRFDQERRILARLDHPHIARLLDGGMTDDGRPWLAMELVDGMRIDHYCDQRPLGIEERLRLFSTVAEAVQAAHRSLIIHRDLKPANILVTPDGQVKLLDFGIAKPLDTEEQAADATRTMQRMLTPSYATPEQIRGESLTTASDIYQLGLLLYELLTGRRAQRLEKTTPQAIERAVCVTPATRPSLAVLESAAPDGDGADAETLAAARDTTPTRLARRLRGDLDTIVLTALRKEPKRRYASAEQIAADVRRHLKAQPVQARRDSLAYRTSKFLQRHAIGVVAAAAVLSLVATLVAFYTVRLQQERDRARREAETARRVSELLTDLFEVSDPEQARGREIPAREILDQGAERIADQLTDEPAVHAELAELIGEIYVKLGLYEEAEPLLQRVLTLRHQLHGEEHIDVAHTMSTIASLLARQGKYEEAERVQRRALAMAVRVTGPADPEVATMQQLLADQLWFTGDYQEAEALSRRALALLREHFGAEHPTVAASMDTLAVALNQQGKRDEAEKYYRQALAMRRQLLGEDHPDVIETLSGLGVLIFDGGDYVSAEALFRQAVAKGQRVYGHEHPDVLTMTESLAITLHAQGELQEAEALLRNALAVRRETLGPGHPRVAFTFRALATTLRSAGALTESEQLYRDSLAIFRQNFGDENHEVAKTSCDLGSVLQQSGRLTEAETSYRRCLELLEALVGADHPHVGRASARLASLMLERREFAAAESYYNRALAILQAKLPAGHQLINDVESGLQRARAGHRSSSQ